MTSLPPSDVVPEFVESGPDVTPLFTELLEQEAARRGLPSEPWVGAS